MEDGVPPFGNSDSILDVLAPENYNTNIEDDIQSIKVPGNETTELNPFAPVKDEQGGTLLLIDSNLNSPEISTPRLMTPQSIHSAQNSAPTPQSANKDPENFVSTPSNSRLNPIIPSISPSQFKLPTRKFTDPSVFREIPDVDSISETITKVFGNQSSGQIPRRSSMTLEQAVEFPDPYVPLLASKSWRAVAQLARIDLISLHPIMIDQIMKLWHLRLSALMKLKLFDVAQAEVDRLKIEDLQSYWYSDYQDVFPGLNGTMISCDLLVFVALLPMYKGNYQESIHKLYKLLYAQKPWDFKATKEEHNNILLHVVEVIVKMSNFSLALELIKQLIADRPDDIDLWAVCGRLNLQIGDVDNAKISFEMVEKLVGISTLLNDELPELTKIPRPELVLSQRGLLAFSQDKYAEATTYYTDLLTLQPNSSSAANNLGVCYLHSGNVGQAVNVLVSFMTIHPLLGGDDPDMLFNLNSMYDLNDTPLLKKRAILKTIIQGCGSN